MSERKEELKQAIREAHARGWVLVPVEPYSKSAAGAARMWSNADWKPSLEFLLEWADHDPYMNLAVKCGTASGLVVIDIDDIEKASGALNGLLLLEERVSVNTERGMHHYFRLPPGVTFPTIGGVGFDICCSGQYVLLPPSIHPNGTTKYELLHGNFDEIPLLPEGLEKLIRSLPMNEPNSGHDEDWEEEEEEDLEDLLDDDEDDYDEDEDDYDELTANEYAKEAEKTAIYPGSGTLAGLTYTALGLAGEAGEVANKLKKVMRDDGSILTQARKGELVDELGDVAWYVARAAAELGASFEYVLLRNIEKLRARKENGTLHGDNRGVNETWPGNPAND